MGGDDTKTYQQPDAREIKRFWTKIWQPKKHNEKAEWINNMTRELEGLEEGPKAEIHTDLLKTTLKNIKQENARPWWNTWIKLHWQQISTEMNRCFEEVKMTWLDDQRKDHIDSKGPK